MQGYTPLYRPLFIQMGPTGRRYLQRNSSKDEMKKWKRLVNTLLNYERWTIEGVNKKCPARMSAVVDVMGAH